MLNVLVQPLERLAAPGTITCGGCDRLPVIIKGPNRNHCIVPRAAAERPGSGVQRADWCRTSGRVGPGVDGPVIQPVGCDDVLGLYGRVRAARHEKVPLRIDEFRRPREQARDRLDQSVARIATGIDKKD